MSRVQGMESRIIQGRLIHAADIEYIKSLIQEQPTWHRTKISRFLCETWNWRDQSGRMKDMACRTLLLKLHRQGLIQLPPPKIDVSKRRQPFKNVALVEYTQDPITCKLKALQPLIIETVKVRSPEFGLWMTLLKAHHYLGFNGTVGENMKYLVYDRQQRPLAALLFGSAAWKAKDRDLFIGWDAPTREKAIQSMSNNMRFLILPWVRVPHLASHILSLITKRIASDWLQVYQHPLYLLETFVEQQRFQGTCYRAANWIRVGTTCGRTRNDRSHQIKAPKKDILVYPLQKDFREALNRTLPGDT